MYLMQSRDEFLGEARGKPVVLGRRAVELQWLELWREGENVGEVLAAFELVLIEGEGKPIFPKDKKGEHGQLVVPGKVAPHMELYTVEVSYRNSTIFRCSLIFVVGEKKKKQRKT